MIYPILRLKQVWSYPPFLLIWIKRNFWDKKHSFSYEKNYNKINQLGPESTLAYIIKNNKSIMRFGDGEFGLMFGAGIFSHIKSWNKFTWCQEFSKEIKFEMTRLLKLKDDDIVIAFSDISNVLHNDSVSKLYTQSVEVHSNMHVEARKVLWRCVVPGQLYGSAFAFLPEHHLKFDWKVLRIFIQNKKVIIITGNISKIQYFKLGQETFFIEAGVYNVFETREKIFNDIKIFTEKNDLSKENCLFLVSLGPTACSVVEFISKLGYTAWDTGHFFQLAEKEIKTFSIT